MLTLIKNKFKKNKSLEPLETTYLLSKSANELLATPKRQAEIKKIKRLLSITEEVWIKHYLYSIKQFVEYVQEVPASEVHHHSEAGGLIDHTLDAIHTGIRVRQGYILPPNKEPEDIHSAADRWTFGVFTAILFHDIGKIITDLELVYRKRGGQFQPWHPWINKIPKGYEYTFRYKDDRQKSLHEKATLSLVPHML
ncbi:MAG: TraI domain-containing protein, partial [Methylococcales bacterium]